MKRTLIAVGIASVIGLSGCASTPADQLEGQVAATTAETAADVASLQAKQKVTDKAAKVEQLYLSAKNDNVIYFAPEHWSTVKSKLAEMRSQVNEFDPNDQGFFGGPSEDDVIESIDETEAALASAAKIKTLVAAYLAQPVEDVTYLTPKIKPQWKKSFAAINRSLANLIADIEDDEETTGYDERRAKIQASLFKLEVKVVINTHYTPLLKRSSQLTKSLIPASYKIVQQELAKLNSAIAIAPRDITVIDVLTKDVENALLRAKNVTTEVKWIRSIERSKAEEIALRYRHTVEEIAQNLVSEDISSLTFDEQMSKIESLVNAKINNIQVAEEKSRAEQAVLIDALKAQLNAALARSQQASVGVQSLQTKMEALVNAKLTASTPAADNLVKDDMTTPAVSAAQDEGQ